MIVSKLYCFNQCAWPSTNILAQPRSRHLAFELDTACLAAPGDGAHHHVHIAAKPTGIFKPLLVALTPCDTSPEHAYTAAMTGIAPKPPRAFLVAVAAAASIMPVGLLLDRLAPAGGDGYGNFGTMALFLLVVLALTLGGIIMGLRRNERHKWLALAALALLVLPLKLMLL